MIIGTPMDQETCLLHGEVDERNGKQHQGLIILWPEIWRSMSRKSKMKEKQNWASEKPKHENARRLTGIYFIEPEDNEFKEIIKNPRKSWTSQPFLQCLVKGPIEGTEQPVARMMITSQKMRVSWKQRNPSGCVCVDLHPKFTKTTLQGKRVIHCIITIWYTNSFLCLKQWRYLQRKQQWTENWEKLANISAWNLAKVRNKSEVIDEARNKGVKVHFASLMDLCNLKNAELEKKHQRS